MVDLLITHKNMLNELLAFLVILLPVKLKYVEATTCGGHYCSGCKTSNKFI